MVVNCIRILRNKSLSKGGRLPRSSWLGTSPVQGSTVIFVLSVHHISYAQFLVPSNSCSPPCTHPRGEFITLIHYLQRNEQKYTTNRFDRCSKLAMQSQCKAKDVSEYQKRLWLGLHVPPSPAPLPSPPSSSSILVFLLRLKP
jgi:hypothetical protein